MNTEIALEIYNLDGSDLAIKAEKTARKIADNEFYKEKLIDTTALAETSVAYRNAIENTFKGDKEGNKQKEILRNKLLLHYKIVSNEVSKVTLLELVSNKISYEGWQKLVLAANMKPKQKSTPKGAVGIIEKLASYVNQRKACMELEWEKDKNATNYIVQYRIKGTEAWDGNLTTSTSKIEIKNLKHGATYEFRVAGSNNRNGRGDYCEPITNMAL